MTTIFVPGQGDVDFPDSMSDDQIAGVIKKQYPLLKGAPADRPPETQTPQAQPERSFGEKALGIGEAGLSALTAIPATVAGSVAGIAKGLTGGKLGTPEGVREAEGRAADVSQALTYQPKTEAGQEALGGFKKAIDESKLAGLPIGDMQAMGALSATKGASTIGGAPKPVRGVVNQGTLAKAQEAKYVLPPSMAKPGVLNNLVEGVAGKIKTAQKASFKNQEVLNNTAREALGLSPEAPLNSETLQAVRKQAGETYEAVKNTGKITADKAYYDALDAIKKPYEQAAKDFPNAANKELINTVKALKRREFDSASAVQQIKVLREMSDKAYRTGDKAIGKATRAASNALEDQVGRHLETGGKPDLLAQFRHAREIIAKSYSVQAALNEGSGNISHAALVRQLKKGKPLSGGLRTAAEISQEFEKATQDVSKIGSPTSVSIFDMGAGMLASEVFKKPWLLLGVMGRPALRSAILSKPGQAMMIGSQEPGQLGMGLRMARGAVENPELLSSLPMANQ